MQSYRDSKMYCMLLYQCVTPQQQDISSWCKVQSCSLDSALEDPLSDHNKQIIIAHCRRQILTNVVFEILKEIFLDLTQLKKF